LLEVLLLLLETALDDLCAGEEALLEISESLVLNHDRGFLVEVLTREAQLLKDSSKVVLLLLVLRLLLVLLLALLHLVTGLVVYRFL